jgi:hypothetical protein
VSKKWKMNAKEEPILLEVLALANERIAELERVEEKLLDALDRGFVSWEVVVLNPKEIFRLERERICNPEQLGSRQYQVPGLRR